MLDHSVRCSIQFLGHELFWSSLQPFLLCLVVMLGPIVFLNECLDQKSAVLYIMNTLYPII